MRSLLVSEGLPSGIPVFVLRPPPCHIALPDCAANTTAAADKWTCSPMRLRRAPRNGWPTDQHGTWSRMANSFSSPLPCTPRQQLHFTLWRVHTTRTAPSKPPLSLSPCPLLYSLSCSKVITKYHARCSFFSAEALKEEGSCNMISHQKRTRACLRASASVPNLLFGVEGNKPCWSGSGLSGV